MVTDNFYVSPSDRISEVFDVDAKRQTIAFVIRGSPKAKARHKLNKKWNFFYNQSGRAENQFKKAAKELLKRYSESGDRNLFFDKDKPLRVKIKFFIKRPKSHFKKTRGTTWNELKQDAPKVPRGDVDNYGKFVLDCLNKTLYYDDNQVVKVTLEKMYDPDNEGKTAISVSRDTDEPNRYD